MAGAEWMLLLIGAVFMVGSFFITEKLSPSELNKLAELSEAELKRIIERALKNAEKRIDEQIESQLDASMDIVERALEKETNSKIMAINEYSDTVLESINKAHNEIMFLYSMLNDKHTELTSLASDLQRLAADVRAMEETYQAQRTAAPAGQLRFVQPVSAVPQQMPAQQQSAARQTKTPAAVTAVQTSTAGQSPSAVQTRQSVPAAAAAVQQTTPIQRQTAQAAMQTAQLTAEPQLLQTTESAASEEKALGMTEDARHANTQQQILVMHKKGMSDIQIAKTLKMGVGEVRLVIGLYRGE